MHMIWLARLDYEQDGFRAAAIRGVRNIWTKLGVDHSYKDGHDIVQTFIDQPTQMVPIAQHEDTLVLQEAIDAAAEYHNGAAEFVIDPEDTTVEVPDDDTSDENVAGVFSSAAFKTALVLVNMAAPQGAPLAAAMHALALARASEDPDLYEEVVDVLVNVFELPLSFETGDDGPEIHIFGEGGPEQMA